MREDGRSGAGERDRQINVTTNRRGQSFGKFQKPDSRRAEQLQQRNILSTWHPEYDVGMCQ